MGTPSTHTEPAVRLRFETENYHFSIDATLQATTHTPEGLAALAAEFETTCGFRLVKVWDRRSNATLFHNADPASLPVDASEHDMCRVTYVDDRNGWFWIVYKTTGPPLRKTMFEELFSRYFKPADASRGWKLKFIKSSSGEGVFKKHLKSRSQKFVTRTAHHRTDLCTARTNLVAPFKAMCPDLLESVELPCAPLKIVADLFHPATGSFFVLTDDQTIQSADAFRDERWCDRQVQKKGMRIFRFTSSETADARDGKALVEKFWRTFTNLIGNGKRYPQPVRIEMASRSRRLVFPLHFRLRERVGENLAEFTRAVEELLGWRVVRIIQPAPDGLPEWEWRNSDVRQPPDDIGTLSLTIPYSKARTAFMHVPLNRSHLDSKEHDNRILAWFISSFVESSGSDLPEFKVIGMHSKFKIDPVDSLHLELSDSAKGPGSSLERKLHGAMSAAQLDPRLQQEVFHKGGLLTRLDFFFPAEKTAVMADGFHFHSKPAAVIKDRVQDRMLQLAGFVVLRYPDTSIEKSPGRCVDEIREVLEERRRR